MMHPSKKHVALTVTGATGLVIASLITGPAMANAATPADAVASSTTSTERPKLVVDAVGNGSVTVTVTGTPLTLVRFQDDTGRTTNTMIRPDGSNTVTIRVDADRVTNFKVTAVSNGEPTTFDWSVDGRGGVADPGTPGDPEVPVTPGDGPSVDLVRYAGDWATISVSGKPGQTYGVTDSAGRWVGSGVLGNSPKNVSVQATDGTKTEYTVSVSEQNTVVGTTKITLDRTGDTTPVTPSPEVPVTPVTPEPEVPATPDPGTDPEAPADPETPFIGDVSVGAVSNGRVAVTVSGPIGAQWMITGEGDSYVTGGFVEGYSTTRTIVVGSGSVKTFTLHMQGGTKTFTVDAR